ncbi:MAG: hypothetical protein C0482_18380 [Gordonia sp.]|jgi:hypothetical protein|uniref:DUF6480 family protein n=1 Tax=Gordonia rubripertincta TaxID=36822 RepID=A0ABT4N3Y4_GORRU|nr:MULTISPECIES: DUF6480 family protein [Mycobacteriales]MBA4024325.1 hypothetical protein [Gordonia sp. (in: high G+C Gram-positive bacteria)]MCZ4553111.1 DUF6480 family protein [Gordonia rubripertincta]OZG27753.1 hypothetical protein BH683_017985 [Williamsia sp. 1138]
MPNRDSEDFAYEPQNPPPGDTAGLEDGGGVTPGDTPPAETGVGGPNHEPPQRGKTVPIVIISLAVLLVLIIAIGLFSRIFGFM